MDDDLKKIMAKNIRRYLEITNKTQRAMCKDLDFKENTVSDWLSAKTYPRIDKIEKMAIYFGCQKSDLIEEPPTYYTDPETARLAQLLHDNPQYKVMFDSTKDLDAESVQKIIDFIKYQRHLEGYDD